MDTRIISKFTDSRTFSKLEGGQNESVKAGDIVVKPVHENAKYLWLSEALNQLQFKEIKIAIPIRSKGGNFIEDSYGATQYFEGKFYEDKLYEKVKACRVLNSIISSIQKPAMFDQWRSPWTDAQDMAWNELSIPAAFPEEITLKIDELMRLKCPLNLAVQLIHTDLAGNILFDNNHIPVIIDFSAGYFPKEYAEILLIADSIAWYGATLDALSLVEMDHAVKYQLILRAVIFRLTVACFRYENNLQQALFDKEYAAFESLIELVKINIIIDENRTIC